MSLKSRIDELHGEYVVLSEQVRVLRDRMEWIARRLELLERR